MIDFVLSYQNFLFKNLGNSIYFTISKGMEKNVTLVLLNCYCIDHK